jgi:uncharacterized protein YebE (UPF0316 family)
MNIEAFISTDIFTFVVLPILIFLSRILDQSVGILRIIFATKGLRTQSFFTAFFESFIWLMAISQIMNHLDNIFCYLAFAGGFATGNVVGILLEKRISIGYVMVRVIFQKDSEKTIQLLKQSEYRFTTSNGDGMEGPVKILFCTTKRKNLKNFLNILKQNNPLAFYTVEDVKMIKEGEFGHKRKWFIGQNFIK